METRLRAALLDHLRADPALMDAINLVDEAEVERASPPWLALVASASTDWGTKTEAGREVRILVEPGKIDDIAASNLARNVVRKIEENLVYPGQIMVTVVRETRATEIAH